MIVTFRIHLHNLEQGSLTPGPQTATDPWPVRNQAAEQEVSAGPQSKAPSVFTVPAHH